MSNSNYESFSTHQKSDETSDNNTNPAYQNPDETINGILGDVYQKLQTEQENDNRKARFAHFREQLKEGCHCGIF